MTVKEMKTAHCIYVYVTGTKSEIRAYTDEYYLAFPVRHWDTRTFAPKELGDGRLELVISRLKERQR